MRYLRNTADGHILVWTEALAKRKGLEEVDASALPQPAPVDPDPSAANPKPDQSQAKASGDVPDIYGITDKDQLREIAKGVGIAFAGATGLKTMQAKLAEHFGITAPAGVE